jgi:hypothetical protein
MVQYEIKVEGIILTIRVQDNSTHVIIDGSTIIGQIYPVIYETGIVWETKDLSATFAKKITKALEIHYT